MNICQNQYEIIMSIFFVAEIGINHNGDVSVAKKLINSAADFGFDAVKFQKREISEVYSKNFLHRCFLMYKIRVGGKTKMKKFKHQCLYQFNQPSIRQVA